MKQTINFNGFVDAFHAHERDDNFSYDGLRVLYDYLTDYENEANTEITLDVIDLCCEYAEGTVDEVADMYNINIDGLLDNEATEIVVEYLEYNTAICGFTKNGSIVYFSNF